MSIQFKHSRNFNQDGLVAKGGNTVALEVDNDKVSSLKPGEKFTAKMGFSVCSDRDNYNKKIGREICLERLENVDFTVLSVSSYFVEGEIHTVVYIEGDDLVFKLTKINNSCFRLFSVQIV